LGKDSGTAAIWPTACKVSTNCSYKLIYTVGEKITKGGGIFVWPPWGGSDPQVDAPGREGCVTCRTDANAVLRPTMRERGHWYYATTEGDRQVRMFVAVFIEVAEGKLQPGDVVEIAFANFLSQYTYERDKIWEVKTIADGKGLPLWGRTGPAVTYLPGEPAKLRIFAPSMVGRGEKFSIKVGVFDEFDNPVMEPLRKKVHLSSSFPMQGLPHEMDLSGRPLACRKISGLNCQGTGFCYIEAAADGMSGRSNPILVREDEPELRIFWGDTHVHTNLSDGVGPPEEAYQMARDVYGLDFAALCDHDTNGEDWERTKRAARLFDSPGRFVTIPAWEWTSHRHGHRNVYFLSEEKSVPSIGSGKDVSLEELYAALKGCGGPAMVIPHHPIWFMDFSGHDPNLERVAEIYSIWGSSEFQDNELQFLAKKQPNEDLQPQVVREALARGYRFGFVGSSDCHLTRCGQPYSEDKRRGPITPQTDKHFIVFGSGLAAVMAPKLERGAIWDSICARSCYATTGVRMVVDFRANGRRCGAEMEAEGNVKLSILAAGTENISRVEIVKDGEVFHQSEPGTESVELSVEDRPRSGSYYYAKVIQEDGNMAWSSPVWVGSK